MNTNQTSTEINTDGLTGLIAAIRLGSMINTTSVIPVDEAKAHQSCLQIIKELDAIELKHYFTDLHTYDVKTNKSEAFYALQKAIAAFRELGAKF